MVNCLAQGLEQNKCTLRKTQNNGSAVVILTVDHWQSWYTWGGAGE